MLSLRRKKSVSRITRAFGHLVNGIVNPCVSLGFGNLNDCARVRGAHVGRSPGTLFCACDFGANCQVRLLLPHDKAHAWEPTQVLTFALRSAGDVENVSALGHGPPSQLGAVTPDCSGLGPLPLACGFCALLCADGPRSWGRFDVQFVTRRGWLVSCESHCVLQGVSINTYCNVPGHQ